MDIGKVERGGGGATTPPSSPLIPTENILLVLGVRQHLQITCSSVAPSLAKSAVRPCGWTIRFDMKPWMYIMYSGPQAYTHT